MPIIWIDGVGLHRVRLDEVQAYLDSSYRGIYGAGIDLSVSSSDGQKVRREAEDIDRFLSVAEMIYAGRSPAGAGGAQLARLVQLNGLRKSNPERSATIVTLFGDAGTPVAAGALIGNATDPTADYETTEARTIGGGGTVSAPVRSLKTGPIPGNAGDLTVVKTIIDGWTGVTNPSNVSLGNTGETDGQLRSRRAASVALPSQGIVDGLRAALLAIPNVTQAIVRENDQDTTVTLADGGPLAPHAFQALVLGGDPAPIGAALWAKKGLGCTQVGTQEVVVVDDQGTSHTMKYDIPADKAIYVEVRSPAALSAEMQQAIKDEFVKWDRGDLTINGEAVAGPQIGEDAEYASVWEPIVSMRMQYPTLSISAVKIGDAPSPTGVVDVPVAYNQIARYLSANITFASP